jgi:hypothetical protein
MERMVTMDETCPPRAAIQSNASGAAGRAPVRSSTSPPRMRAPSAASPAAMPARSVPTAAMAATPSAKQARTIRKDRTPPRNSRRASLKPSAARSPMPKLNLRHASL